MSDKLVGSWTMYKTENFEEFIKEYGRIYCLFIKIRVQNDSNYKEKKLLIL